jgi:polyisoprenoid-binding protein YceI
MTTTLAETRLLEAFPGTRWRIDAARSSFEFRVQHYWGLVTVCGRFERFEGTLLFDQAGAPHFQVTLDAASLDTGNARRDEHLRSAAFFNVGAAPVVRFTSTSLVAGEQRVRVSGWLEAAAWVTTLDFDADVRLDGYEFEVTATALVDQRELGMTWSPLRAVRAPAKLLARVRLKPC